MGREEEEKMGASHAPEEKGSQRLSTQREMSRKHSMGGEKKKVGKRNTRWPAEVYQIQTTAILL